MLFASGKIMATSEHLGKEAAKQLTLFLFFLGLVIFISAGSLFYVQGWIYWFVFSTSCVLITLYIWKNDKNLLKSRLQAGPTAEKEKTQKTIQSMLSVVFFFLFVLPGIDFRFHWSNVSLSFILISNVLVAVGFYIVFLVFKQNTYTSATIEVQKGQKVTTDGLYKYVRHPMYAGALLLIGFTPLALGSYWTMLLLIPFFAGLVRRIFDEEQYLNKHLPGYKEYTRKTIYRLVPFIW